MMSLGGNGATESKKMAAVSNLFESQLDRKLNKHIDKQDKGKSLHYSYDSFNSIAEVSRQLILWPRVSLIACLLSQSDYTCSFHHFKLLWLGFKKDQWNKDETPLSSSIHPHPFNPPPFCSIAGYQGGLLIERNFHFFFPMTPWCLCLPFPRLHRRIFFLNPHMSFGKPPKVSYSLGRKKKVPPSSLLFLLGLEALMCSFEVTSLRLH